MKEKNKCAIYINELKTLQWAFLIVWAGKLYGIVGIKSSTLVGKLGLKLR